MYKIAFFAGGPDLTYSMAGRNGEMVGGGREAEALAAEGETWAARTREIQSLDDGTGLNRGFLGSEANWQAMKDIETRNLLVPVVGDFRRTQSHPRR